MITYIGTTSEQDLSVCNSDVMRLVKSRPDSGEEIYLKYPNVWLLTDQHESCSCCFRNIEFPNVEHLGFDEPQEWFEEDEESINATHQIYNVISEMLNNGHCVESITFWVDSKSNFIEKEVSLKAISVEKFRFFDGYRFEYVV